MTTAHPSSRNNRRISFVPVIIFVLLASTSAPVAAASLAATSSTNQALRSSGNLATFTTIDFVPNIETIGVVISGVNMPRTAELMYRRSSESNWHPGHPLVGLDDGRLVGSLFGLSPATTYDIRISDGSNEISGSVTTQQDELQFTPLVTLHVNDDASPGGDGSVTAPFRSIQEAVNHAGPGTQVLVADGIYHETISLPASGSEGNWIQVKAEGSGAILDGSDTVTGNIWKADESRSHVWIMKIGAPITYLARDQKRFYKYDTLSGLSKGLGHNNIPMNEGWYFEPTTLRLYVRSLDNPSGHTWQLPRLNDAFDTIGHDWLWIEGFEMRLYGAQYNGCGVCLQNASHVVIRKNKIHNIQLGIFINWNGSENQGNDTRIEYNEIYDPPVNEWPWKAVKGSSMEGTAIVVRGHIGAIVRGNELHNFFNGIYTGSSAALENTGVAFDADIYDNHIHHISDDGLEPEGTCINQRFRNNTVDTMLVGISLAPITQGPTWVLRSVFTNFTGTSIKWDLNSDGVVLIYQNTSWTNTSGLNAMSMIRPIHNVVMRNNIFQGNGYAFEEPFKGSTGSDWNNDNWYTTRTSTNPHFKWENTNYYSIADLCAATALECNGHEGPPGLTNPSGGDFTLLSSSPNIDRGVAIPGINDDFRGSGPDVGAYESTFGIDVAPTVTSSVRANSNPTNATSVNFTVTFSESVTGVDAAPPFNDFQLVGSPSITGASITSVTLVSTATYMVSVNTGSGNGVIRLDVIDDDSILDSGGHPLGGTNTGNGNFTAGQEYTIDKSFTDMSTETFTSNGTYDGWTLESGENTNAGATLDRSATTFNVGDDSKNRQYRGILSFNTSSLPDSAIIHSAQVRIKRQGFVGNDPFTTHGNLLLDINNFAFSNNIVLQTSDFSAAASTGAVQEQLASQTFSWYFAQLGGTNLGFINKTGATQFRLLFSQDDNDDLGADYVKFFSGNSITENQPQLIVSYSPTLGGVNPSTQPPVITSGSAFSIPENTAIVGTITATDADLPAQTLTYSITAGLDSSLFTINSSTGELAFINAPNYEAPMDAGAENIYNVTIQASDGTLSTTQDIAVNVTAANDNSPVITSNGGGTMATINLAENTGMVTTVTATDADLPTGILTYSISGSEDSALFNINPSTGELALNTAPDYEVPVDSNGNNIYYVAVQVSDGAFAAKQDIAVIVTAVNDNAPVITSSGSAGSPENTNTVTTIGASDLDLPAQILTYSISGGADFNLFSINSSTGELAFIHPPDFEFPMDAGLDNIYDVAIQVSDGSLAATQDLVVSVLPVNDINPVITSNGIVSVSENLAAAVTIIAADADQPAQILTYSIIGGMDSVLFSINSSTGALAFVTAPNYEVPTDAGFDNIYNVTVQVSDGTLNITQDLAISVLAVNDNSPIITSKGIFATPENATAISTTVTARDADLPAQILSYSILGGADLALLSINSSTGALTFITAPDYELPVDMGMDNIYHVTIQVSDGILTATQDIAITVIDNDESPATLPIYDFNTLKAVGYLRCSDVTNYEWHTSACNGESGGCWISDTALFGYGYAGFQRHDGNLFCGLNLP